jgi:hypothetical protein
MVFGVLFILNGFLNLALLDGRYNFLAFHIQNVLFSFVVGVLLMFFGMYGRVGSALPHDNPYYKARHPEEAERAERIRALRESASATALQQSHRAAPTPKAVGGTETKAAESAEASESTKAAESKAAETKASETEAAEPPRTTDP